MSGHSKWSTIKRQKGIADSKRSAAFSKLGRLITIAARTGGKDPAMNFRLRLAIDKAREVNMPNANIERAVAAGAGEGKGLVSKEALYEGFGPAGVAVIVEAVTDNPNRTSAEIRSLFSKAGGSLGAQNSVSWMFALRGVIRLAADTVTPELRDDFFLAAIDAGAEDVREEGEQTLLLSTPDKLQALKLWTEQRSVTSMSAELEFIPTTTVVVADADQPALHALLEALDDHPDVTNVFSNDA